MRKLRNVEEVLKGVKVPGFDIDLISSGVVRRLRISRDGEKLVIYVGFKESDPSCGFCKFINHTLWSSIVREIKDALNNEGFREVLVVDTVSGAVLGILKTG